MSEEHKSLNQIIDYRKEKLSKLKEAGIDPYPQKFTPNQFSREIINNFENFQDKDVIIAGRIMSIRKMGKASFFHLQDQFGKIQAFIKRDNIGDENYNNFKLDNYFQDYFIKMLKRLKDINFEDVQKQKNLVI